MKCFGNNVGSPLLTLLNILPEIPTYTAENLDEKGTTAMWSALYSMLQRLWLAEEEEEAGKCYGRHFYIIDPPRKEKTSRRSTRFTPRQADMVLNPHRKPFRHTITTKTPSTATTNLSSERNADLKAKYILLALDKSENKEEAGKGFKRLTASNRKYILFASSSVDCKAPENPNKESTEFWELKKKQALLYMQASIIAQRSGSHVIDLPLTTTLWNGTLCNANHHGPTMSLLIFFAVPAAPLIGGESEMTQDEFDIRKDSNNLSLLQIKAATHLQVQIPKDDKEFKATVENYLCILDFVLGKGSFAYAKINVLLQALNKKKGAFKVIATFDSKFVASFMQVIDIKVKIFIKSCAKETQLKNVNFAILDFTEEVSLASPLALLCRR
jgi:hypothetical protein